MRTTISALAISFLAAAVPAAAPAQSGPNGRLPVPTRPASLSGPRFGVTVLSQQMRDKLSADRNINVGAVISQFGWQFEKQFLGKSEGVTAVYELVLLAGGLDQGSFLPSATWLVGVRNPKGAEIGVGPNLTPAGVALALAAGVNFRGGSLNFPVNVAAVPSKYGTRLSVLTGFTLR